ncbi:ABC transporter substrate-binding protein [Gordonia jinhuaensis]|uniref:ABC transporter substrate-binding protein n=1 Tax=Gordonia jinhuaensis TaxID=1517702 RepID=UPI0035710016
MLKRLPFLAVVAVALATALVACSSGSTSTSESANSSSAPVTIAHQYGSTQIPAHPTKVVTFGGAWSDALIKLGVPITAEFVTAGYSGPNNRFEWTPEHSSTVVPVQGVPDISAVAKFDPDVILTGYLPDKSTWERLSQIAPTIPVLKQGTQVDSWEDITLTAGEIFGKQKQAAAAVAEVNDQLAKVKEKYPNAQGKTFTFGQLTPQQQFGVVTSDNDPSSKLMAQMGLALDPAVKSLSKDGSRVLVSAERVDLFSSDLLIFWPLVGGPESFDKIPGWSSLPAVRNGSTVFLTNDNAAAFSTPSIYSVPWAINKVEPALAKVRGNA